MHGQPASQRFDYVEGFVIVDEGLINNWRSSFFSPRNPVKLSSINADGGVLYCLEITRNYDESTAETIDQVLLLLLLFVIIDDQHEYIIMNMTKDKYDNGVTLVL